jgi:hypothetical protein
VPIELCDEDKAAFQRAFLQAFGEEAVNADRGAKSATDYDPVPADLPPDRPLGKGQLPRAPWITSQGAVYIRAYRKDGSRRDE